MSAFNLAVQGRRKLRCLPAGGRRPLPAGIGKGEYEMMDPSYEELRRGHPAEVGDGLSGDLHEFVTGPALTVQRARARLTAYAAGTEPRRLWSGSYWPALADRGPVQGREADDY